jgi:predicted Zn finger-like uncharacterized protein
VKFLCDRCKTRYSIGDDRVRGKILKIRCKNCANVITVREGMSSEGDDPPGDAADRDRKPVNAATEVLAPAPSLSAAAAGASRAANEPAAIRGAARDPLAGLTGKRSTNVDTVRGLGRGNARSADSPARGEGAAVASPAPAALEEEWYVSIDGEQAGPFSLAAAQRWVTQQPVDGELHCWSEGFDDWLPVDKVSHFRGLRKRPIAQAAPPPLPRATAGAPRPAPAEDEPKPLFASTMASLERGAPAMSVGLGLPPPAAAPAPAAPAQATPIAARGDLGIRPTNGAQGPATTPLGRRAEARAGARAEARSEARPEARSEARPAGKPDARPEARADAQRAAALEARPAGKPDARPEARADAQRAAALEARPAGKPDARPEARADAQRAAAFEARPAGKPGARDAARGAPAPASPAQPFEDPFGFDEGDDLVGNSDGKTVLEAMPFDDAPVEPGRASAAAGAPAAEPEGTAPAAPAHAAPARSDFGSDDELDIGEVSRVVNLADVARGARAATRSSAAGRGAESTVGSAAARWGVEPAAGSSTARRGTESPPGSTGIEPGVRASTRSTAQAASLAPDGEPGVASAPVVRAQHRGLIALLVVAVVLVLGVIGAVVLVTRSDDAPSTSLGTVQDIDTSRPDDPIAHRPVGSASAAVPTPSPPAITTRPHPRTAPSPGSGQIAEAPAAGNALGGDEIEDVARKHQDMTQRCYMRSQRGADAILIGSVKKIAVTLTIDREGNVSDLQLSDHAADTLGKCLTGAIRTWKFRPSAGGTFKFSMNFVDG